MRRIQRALDKEELVQELTTGEQPCFTEIWRLLLFAAMLGFKVGKKEPLGQVSSGKSIMDAYFANCPAWPGGLYLLGIVERNSPTVMHSSDASEDEVLTIFEQYANGGLQYLKERLDQKTPTLTAILDIINEVITRDAKKPVNLGEISI